MANNNEAWMSIAETQQTSDDVSLDYDDPLMKILSVGDNNNDDDDDDVSVTSHTDLVSETSSSSDLMQHPLVEPSSFLVEEEDDDDDADLRLIVTTSEQECAGAVETTEYDETEEEEPVLESEDQEPMILISSDVKDENIAVEKANSIVGPSIAAESFVSEDLREAKSFPAAMDAGAAAMSADPVLIEEEAENSLGRENEPEYDNEQDKETVAQAATDGRL